MRKTITNMMAVFCLTAVVLSCQKEETIDTNDVVAEYVIEKINASDVLTGKGSNNITLSFNDNEQAVTGTFVADRGVNMDDQGNFAYNRAFTLSENPLGATRLEITLWVNQNYEFQFGEFFFDNGVGTGNATKFLHLIVRGDVTVKGITGTLENGTAEVFDNTFTSQTKSFPFSFSLDVAPSANGTTSKSYDTELDQWISRQGFDLDCLEVTRTANNGFYYIHLNSTVRNYKVGLMLGNVPDLHVVQYYVQVGNIDDNGNVVWNPVFGENIANYPTADSFYQDVSKFLAAGCDN